MSDDDQKDLPELGGFCEICRHQDDDSKHCNKRDKSHSAGFRLWHENIPGAFQGKKCIHCFSFQDRRDDFWKDYVD